MKKYFLFLVICFVLTSLSATAESWDDYAGLDRAWDGQKTITNKEFEEAINYLESDKKKKEEKQKKKRIKKFSGGGTSLHKGLDPMSEIQAQEPIKSKDDEGQLVNLPVDLYIDGKIVEKGFYNVFAEKDKKDNNIYIILYQAHYPKGKIKGYETDDDYGADTINFAKYEEYNDRYLKIMYGSLDFNAYGYAEIYKEYDVED